MPATIRTTTTTTTRHRPLGQLSAALLLYLLWNLIATAFALQGDGAVQQLLVRPRGEAVRTTRWSIWWFPLDSRGDWANAVSTTTRHCQKRARSAARGPLSATTSAAAEVEEIVVSTIGEAPHDDEAATTTIADASSAPRSSFGTKEYWDEMYQGRGDFPGDEYSWYCGWDDTLKKHVAPYLHKDDRLLVPGVGNDRLLLDLVRANYQHITAQDYSVHAVERQRDLLSHYVDDHVVESTVTLTTGDVRNLPREWTEAYDAVIEKGLLDAVYLSGDGNVELAVAELLRTLRPGGVFVSVSGVVPDDLRRQMFGGVTWLRDGSHDLRAGCFIFQKPTR